MKTINLLAAVTALLMAASPASAANWIYIISGTNGSDYYYDADTIQRSGNQVTVWEKQDASRDKTEKVRERKVRTRYDCAARTATMLNFVSYYPDGTNESFNWAPHELKEVAIIPDAIAENMMKAVCP